VTIAYLVAVLVGMWFNEDTRVSLIAGIVFLAIVVISFYAFGINKRVPADLQADDQTERKAI
jgi:amino acid transporter, AAT family